MSAEKSSFPKWMIAVIAVAAILAVAVVVLLFGRRGSVADLIRPKEVCRDEFNIKTPEARIAACTQVCEAGEKWACETAERPKGKTKTPGSIGGSVCERVRGRWVADVNASTGIWDSLPSKVMIVEERNVKLWALSAGKLSNDSSTGWNTQAPTEEAGACVFVTREAAEGSGFGFSNPYVVVSKIRLKPGTDGIEMTVGRPTTLRCLATLVVGTPARNLEIVWRRSTAG